MARARLGVIAIACCLLVGACVEIYDAISAYNARYRSEARMRLYRPLAENGNRDAQFQLGVMYASGFGAPRDQPKALFWYRKAAAQHSAKAERNLGIAYDLGEGVEKDLAQAAFWYRGGAEDGDLYSQHNIGRMYAQGEDVERDKTRARYWFDQENMSADQLRLVEGLYLKD
jgi:TPR repeat protein